MEPVDSTRTPNADGLGFAGTRTTSPRSRSATHGQWHKPGGPTAQTTSTLTPRLPSRTGTSSTRRTRSRPERAGTPDHGRIARICRSGNGGGGAHLRMRNDKMVFCLFAGERGRESELSCWERVIENFLPFRMNRKFLKATRHAIPL